jgi:SPX domain protein involved in polyphosphate accumulation
MKFGKDFRNHLEGTLPDWKDKYLAYKALKKLIKTLPPDAADDQPPPPLPHPAGDSGDGDGDAAEEGLGFGDVALGNWFARILDVELHKLNDFYMEREEWYVIRLQVRTSSFSSLSPVLVACCSLLVSITASMRTEYGVLWAGI